MANVYILTAPLQSHVLETFPGYNSVSHEDFQLMTWTMPEQGSEGMFLATGAMEWLWSGTFYYPNIPNDIGSIMYSSNVYCLDTMSS